MVRVVITGLGAASALGHDVPMLWDEARRIGIDVATSSSLAFGGLNTILVARRYAP